MGRFTQYIDWLTFVPILGLSIFGLFILLTVDKSLFLQQLLFVFIGLVLIIGISNVEPDILRWLGPVFYIVSVIFILVTYMTPEIRGAHRWLVIGQMQIQPSELAKPFLIVGFARFISLFSPRDMKNIPLHIILFLPVFLLVYKQPDFGTSAIYAIIWLGMMLAGGLRLRLLLIAFILITISVPLFSGMLAQYQKERIYSFINPSFDPQGAGYNALQSVISVGSGEIFGRGLGRGTQSHLRFLPENHTDFIFATLVEEFGFFGGLLLLGLYFLLLWHLVTALLKGKISDSFNFIVAVGIFCMILSQVFINVGMNMGIVPVTGITLPLVSYGGSSLLASMVSFGVLWSCFRIKPILS